MGATGHIIYGRRGKVTPGLVPAATVPFLVLVPFFERKMKYVFNAPGNPELALLNLRVLSKP